MVDNNIVYKKVTDLTEKTEALDNDLLMVGHDGTGEFRKFKWSNFMNNLKAKFVTWLFDGLKTTDKTLVGAINEVKDSNDDKANKAELPTKTSQLTNDSGFLTAHQDISGKINYSDIIDNLTSTATNKPLSAKQGNELKGQITDVSNNVAAMAYCQTSVIEYIKPLYTSRKRADGVFLAAKSCTDLPNQDTAWFIKWSIVEGGTTVLIEAIPYYGHGSIYKKQYNYSDNTIVFNWTNGCMGAGPIGFTDNTGSIGSSFLRKDIQTGRVDFHFECTNMDTAKTALNTAFATIPGKYRPGKNITVMGICWETNANNYIPVMIKITTAGAVMQCQSSSYKITDAYFDAVWFTNFDDYTVLT